MSIVLRRTCLKAKNNVFPATNCKNMPFLSCLNSFLFRPFSEDNKSNQPEFINSTIMVETGLNVQELPVVVRKLKNITEIDDIPAAEDTPTAQDSVNYHLIQAEFKQCVDLRDVFSLLTKCTKITPNIALGAMERIHDLEKNPETPIGIDNNTHVNMAKGAILDKLVKVVIKTEDTQTILNVLKTVSTFMDPYKYKFCNELLLRAIDNRLSIEQLCEFIQFLTSNKNDPKYSETIDKLWVGFVQREAEINELNIVGIFSILPALKVSKKAILNLLEQKFFDIWSKIDVIAMQDILNSFLEEKYSSMQSFAAVGRWLYTNIHALDEDSLLDILTKLTRLNYTDVHIEKAVEKYMKLKGSRIESHILIVGVLNYCMQFHIRNDHILNTCSEYYLRRENDVPPSFLKSFIYPFGFLCFNPKSTQFWDVAETELHEKLDKIPTDDLASMVLSLIYIGKYPVDLVNKILIPEYLVKVNSPDTLKKLHLIDTALSLECLEYSGPLLPKDQWSKPISLDARVKNIVEKMRDSLVAASGGADKVSIGVLVPYMYSDVTYLIDVMLHPAGLGSNTFNWKLKSAKNENTAILIHLPDHYCSDNESLIGPQVLRKRLLRLLGFKVVSLKYSVISQLYTSFNTSGLKKYLSDSIHDAESSDRN
ncbi:FAST kinase domain-containing protein 3, mitochondrial-like [Pectinophora gossypiella]|uniref:FAST kinase domain-containing protein 3, mitochondrial-like n=1 Tax=Pectinophora gossypiella TaxID=13191 RepID=UPI00214E1DF4|nr:FAST kinase domain-containing protein 3, mitochondrial-like [Pectinophora gossypiella]